MALYLLYAVPAVVPLVVFQPFLQFFRQTRTPDPITWVILGVFAIAFGVLPVLSGILAFFESRLGRTIVNVSSTGITIAERAHRAHAQDRVARCHRRHGRRLQHDRFDAPVNAAHRRPAMAAQPVGPATERLLVAISKLTRGGGVTIKTTHGLTTFGEGLSDDEIRYLHSTVRRRLIYGH